MRYTITSSQLNFFRKEGKIEFEDLYTQAEIQSLKELLDHAKTAKASGRDLQRDNPPLLSALHTTRLGQLAAGLFCKRRLRIVFTQYGPFFEGNPTIDQISCMTETGGGSILDLESGKVTFYSDEFALDFAELQFPYLLVVFATDKARYRFQETDPCIHQLKKLGYGFGDLITEETHPLIAK